ncbi:peptide chain release factor 2 [Aminipila butyrica]|uniref:Peptide chain release factor 2 n=1 Tax=Aminipila butyrica TaxID=433296 RepID=A0A858C0B8_9FIRM|nr:peptide chain release factor 2 [Aminipila butyrica]QIB70504.1 peptide chain release factor 2 [Aminipila butyrica]
MVELDQIKYELPESKANLMEVGDSLDLAGLKSRLEEIDIKTQVEGFWEDREAAQKLLKEKKSLENKINGYEGLEQDLEDIQVLIEMAEESEAHSTGEENAQIAAEIREAYEQYKSTLESMRLNTLLTGEYDRSSAIFTIHAGTGGVDAMDWAEMLLRMYTRWSEKKGYKTKVIDLQDDTEAGIKSATVIVEGENAYGYLKNERGVHRLVRISPFNSQGKRQTSFALLEVMPELDEDIHVDIDPEDLRIDTYRSSGAGGQHVNKTDSAIRITHLPTNIVVTCQNERSQHQNKDMAMKLLKAKLTELAEQEHKDNLRELKGDFSQNTWGSQIRSYVFQPYTMVKDHRTGAEVGNVQAVMDGEIDYFINEKLKLKP